MEYAIYLRKSRADRDLEAAGGEDTLERHRRTLLEMAARQHLTVTQIYEEVVSGENLAARPEMQKLLNAVDQGCFAGVLVMEVERLARGDTIDQGIVAQSFKFSNTKIITPIKTYDPNDEFDEEYFEFGLFMSRREYKTINRRLQRGRVASVNEGKWPAHMAPYGYRRVKLEREKGWTLEVIEEEAQWVRRIFTWYTEPSEYPAGTVQQMGPYLIAKRLNGLGIKTRRGSLWTGGTIKEIVTNPTYVGMVRWGWRQKQQRVEDGAVITSRPRSSDYIVKPGIHPAIIDQETFDKAQIRAKHPSKPGPKQIQIKNPLAGLVICGQCGHSMVRRPFGSGRSDQLMCAYPECSTVASDLAIVEAAVLEALERWLEGFEAEPQTGPVSKLDTTDMEAALAALDRDLQQLDAQEGRAYDLVEQGVYTSEVFLARMRTISDRREKLTTQAETIRQELDRIRQSEAAGAALIPQLRHVLDAYPSGTIQEKNNLLRSVLEKAEYTKTRRDRWKGGGDMQLTLFPRIPK
jgi:DNA invertase Pin-like site-specific DNA recombinase